MSFVLCIVQLPLDAQILLSRASVSLHVQHEMLFPLSSTRDDLRVPGSFLTGRRSIDEGEHIMSSFGGDVHCGFRIAIGATRQIHR